MHEQGWQDFLAADGVDGVVGYGGATAVFRRLQAARRDGKAVFIQPA